MKVHHQNSLKKVEVGAGPARASEGLFTRQPTCHPAARRAHGLPCMAAMALLPATHFTSSERLPMDKDDVISTVNDLIECCKDGEFGFRASADHMRNEQTKRLFLQRADECNKAAAELRPFVVNMGGTPEDSGSTGGAMHRGWVAVKGTLSSYSDRQILEDTERAEDKAAECYREALNRELPSQLRAVIDGQYLGVQRNHTQIKQLRDLERAHA
jgi:uncharacterized protein (TIGR02284 family)